RVSAPTLCVSAIVSASWQPADMHFHVPKPLHGWREFAGEVGIIVIGVLIALGVEQVVQTVHDRRVADESRRAINLELGEITGDLSKRVRTEPCIVRRLNEVDT